MPWTVQRRRRPPWPTRTRPARPAPGAPCLGSAASSLPWTSPARPERGSATAASLKFFCVHQQSAFASPTATAATAWSAMHTQRHGSDGAPRRQTTSPTRPLTLVAPAERRRAQQPRHRHGRPTLQADRRDRSVPAAPPAQRHPRHHAELHKPGRARPTGTSPAIARSTGRTASSVRS